MVELPELLVIQVVEVAAKLALVVDHARVDQGVVEIEPVEREIGKPLVTDDVGLADEQEIDLTHAIRTRSEVYGLIKSLFVTLFRGSRK